MAQTLIGDLWEFMKTNKKWWLLPALIMLLLAAALIIISHSSALSPFVYALF